MALKVIIGHKGKAKSVSLDSVRPLSGKRIGDTFNGEILDLPGYTFRITGGSDTAGFPMRRDVDSSGKRRILAIEGVGLRKKAKGIKQRKTVAGNTIGARTAAVNVAVVKEGSSPLFDAEEPAQASAKEA